MQITIPWPYEKLEVGRGIGREGGTVVKYISHINC